MTKPCEACGGDLMLQVRYEEPADDAECGIPKIQWWCPNGGCFNFQRIKNTDPVFFECGSCCHLHHVNFCGDCRQDDERFTDGQLDEKHGVDNWDLAWSDEENASEEHGQ